MFFNSGVFLQFFAAFLLLYWLVRRHLPARNLLLVAASYLFYGWWNPWFLGLLFFSSTFDFCVGLGLARLRGDRRGRWLLGASIAVNLTILGFFKYWDFFLGSLAELLARLSLPFHPGTLGVILPVGISFYTFQSMSYALDVYRGTVTPTRNPVNFLAFVSFFPQLVAGPIQRAAHLLPQFAQTRVLSLAMIEEGVWLMIWGMFKKVVVADNLAPLVDLTFGARSVPAVGVLLGTLAFGFQIYCDFSGYSDIARGTARLLGFDLTWNFNLPYVSTSLQEFWRRWHISLSTWLRDYLYISLGGNRRGSIRTYLNLLVTMLLGGLWHGAAWNFVLWGLWHGGGLSVQRACTPGLHHRVGEPGEARATTRPVSAPGPARRLGGWFLTFGFVFVGWMLFRARSGAHVLALLRGLGDFAVPAWAASFALNLFVFLLPLVAVEYWQWRRADLLAPLRLPVPGRALLQGTLLVGIVLFSGSLYAHAPFRGS